MYQNEFKTTFYISLIYSFRMIGLFIILPILSLYIYQIKDATPFLIGVALGVYGLSQALLQIILSIMSDKFGRKPVIVVGLLLFIAGGVVAAMSTGIYGIIIGRAIQGSGAIGSTLSALVADSTREENRLKAMSIVGMSIGLSFLVAMMISPILNSLIGLDGIFWLTSGLGIISMLMLLKIPTPKTPTFHHEAKPVLTLMSGVLKHPQLIRLNIGVCILHATLTALFIAIPSILKDVLMIPESHQWEMYLPVLVIAFILMFPFVMIAEVKRRMRKYFVISVALLTACLLTLAIGYNNLFVLSVALTLFFAAFTFLESCLPSLVSKIAPAGSKGTAMGIFSSSQFFGIFLGGTIGGLVFNHYHIEGIMLFCLAMGLIWMITAYTMKEPTYFKSKVYKLNNYSEDIMTNLQDLLHNFKGVYEPTICLDEKVIYIKTNKDEFNENQFKKILSNL